MVKRKKEYTGPIRTKMSKDNFIDYIKNKYGLHEEQIITTKGELNK